MTGTVPAVAAWRRLGAVALEQLADARLQAHWAVQVVMAAADGQLEARADDSQSALEWREDAATLVGAALPSGHHAGLRVDGLALLWLDGAFMELDALLLDGRTLDDARVWLADRIRPVAARPVGRAVELRDYDMPEHAVARGRRFSLRDREAFAELGRWIGDGWRVLERLRAGAGEASPLRVWPHHFDIDTLVDVGPERQVGIGLSFGDASYDQPYFYVNPAPAPEGRSSLPALPAAGEWAEDWVGAVLTGEALLAATRGGAHPGDGPDQERRALAFLHGALAVSSRLTAG